MSLKKLAFFILPVLVIMGGCANKTAPSSMQQTSSFDSDDGLFLNDANNKIAAYECYGEIYENTPAPVAKTDEEVIGSEVEDSIASTKLSEVPLPDVPLMLNIQVEKWMDYFQGRGRKYFALWLSRSSRYVPMMKQILKENGLPDGLIYLSMIESGFRPYAYSHAKAVGPWQFMKFTGERYGLRVTYWIDERMDPEKSTIAAAQHLKDLYDEFDHWYLAAAGYNAGSGKVNRAIKKYGTEDFWEMSQKKHRYLKPETKNYVPKLLAASLLASDPVKYGFVDIEYQEPIAYEKVLAPEPVELQAVATALEIDLETIKELNPELRRAVTPPNYPNYELKVPVGTKMKFEQMYASIPRYKVNDILVHRVRSGETLSRIAKKYGVATSSVAQYNHLKTQSKLRKNQELFIPVNSGGYTETVAVAKVKKAVPVDHKNAQFYVVQQGDSLWSISRKFSITVTQLRQWNQLHRSAIRPGQRLVVARQKKVTKNVQQASAASENENGTWKTYLIQTGDTLWDISKKLGVSMNSLAEWNKLDAETASIQPGSSLKFRI